MPQAMLTQFAFFMAYFVVSLPAAALIARLGNSKSIMFALGVMVVGCLIVPAATHFETYWLVLVALFVIASGITILQVVANPLAAALGPPERSHFRLTFSQTFNSFGTWLAPMLVSGIILAGGIFAVTHGAEMTPELRAESFRKHRHRVPRDRGRAGVAGAVHLRVPQAARRHEAGGRGPAAFDRHSASSRVGRCSARAAIFLYVGAEVSIGSVMTNFLHEPDMLNIPLEEAGKMVSYYWGGAMVGRFIGSGLLFLVKQRAPWLLAVFALGAASCVSRSRSCMVHRRLSRAVDRPVQLHHVPGDLHVDAGAFHGRTGGHVGPAVPRDRRRRDTAVCLWLDRRCGGPARGVFPAGGRVCADRRVRDCRDQGEDL